MPWGPSGEDAPGCCDDEQGAHLVTHPDIALWRWAYMDLNRHWQLDTPLPADYLDSSLQHLCGGLTWNQFAAMLRTAPPDARGLPRFPGGFAMGVPTGLCLKVFCGGGWHGTLDRQWGSVWRYLSPNEAFRWGRTSASALRTLQRHPTHTTPDMTFTTRRLLGEMFFALLSGPGACPCHNLRSPPTAWEPPDVSPYSGLPGACALCSSPLYRWSLTLVDLDRTHPIGVFWDILWLYVSQTWGPNWHPMHTGFANLGRCVRQEERGPHVRDARGEPSPVHPDHPSRLDHLLKVLALTLWSFAGAPPEEQDTRLLEGIVPSACWPPMAARLRPWDSTRSERRLYFGDIPPSHVGDRI